MSTNMDRLLVHDVFQPAERAAGAPTLVLLHGRGADRRDLAGLRAHLPADWTLVFPEGPFPGAPWGYGPGWAWYRFLGRDRPEPESFASSLTSLDAFLRALPELLGGLDGPLFLGGFSQGGTLSLGWALAKAGGHLGEDDGARPSIVNLSGFLADHPWTRPAPGLLAGTRLFWAHGTADPAIPYGLAVQGRAALEPTGVDLTARDYAIGHWIDPKELADLDSFVRAAG